MSETYDDGTIACGRERLEIRSYYFPLGTKRIPYAHVKGLQRIEMTGALTGRWRLWGTGNPRYWANLDVHRPRKRIGFVVDLGGFVSPVVTPDRPDEFEAVLRARAPLGPRPSRPRRGPFI